MQGRGQSTSRRPLSREEMFAAGLTRLAASCRQEVDDLTLETYTEALCDQTTPEEWEAFTLTSIRVGRFTWFPKVVELLDALREFRGLPSLDAEAVTAYERVLAAGSYTPEGGTSWEFRAVVAQCGRAAAEAFLEAGGHNAFASTFRESDRRERFVAAYVLVARQDETCRLLPPQPLSGLIAGDLASELSAAFDRAAAAEVLERVSGIHSGEDPPPKFTKPPRVVEATEDRLALLKRQAEEIKAAPAAQEV